MTVSKSFQLRCSLVVNLAIIPTQQNKASFTQEKKFSEGLTGNVSGTMEPTAWRPPWRTQSNSQAYVYYVHDILGMLPRHPHWAICGHSIYTS